MISTQDRREAVKLIQEANASGARLSLACKELNISVRTYERWNQTGQVQEDKRPTVIRPEPKNKLSRDNGSPMKASSFLVQLEKLGVKSSFSRQFLND